MNDIELIYQRVKHNKGLLLTNTFAVNIGFTEDVPVIHGTAKDGKFWLYADTNDQNPVGYSFVFLVEYEHRTWFRKRLVKRYTHWHPRSTEQAIQDIEDFLQGTIPIG